MGKLKASLYLEVWRYLQAGCPGNRTLLTSLVSPTNGPRTIRAHWQELKTNGRAEGIKKTTGLQAVLGERPDLFQFATNDRGHLLIELTQYAKMCEPLEEVLMTAPVVPPTPVPTPAASSTASVSADPTGSAPFVSWAAPSGFSDGPPSVVTSKAASLAVAQPGMEKLPMLTNMATSPARASASSVAEAAAAVTSVATALLGEDPAPGGFDPSFGGWDGVLEPPNKKARSWEERTAAQFGISKYGFYMDIVWTPELAMQKQNQRNKESELLRALVRAMEMHAGNPVTLSQLGSDFKVAQLKKDPQFKNAKMLDILKSHEAIFEVETDLATGGWVVKLQPGAQAAVPGAEQALEDQLKVDMQLPERIEEPRTTKERMQALRVELIHALVRRGNRVPLQELGQEPRVQQRKSGLPQVKKLIEFVRLFPNNFQVTSDETQMIVEAASLDVSDQFMIDQLILRSQSAGQGHSKGKGKGGHHSSSSRGPPPPHAPVSTPSWYAGNLGYGPPAQTTSLGSAAALGALVQHMTATATAVGYGYPQPPPTGFSP